jgi:hypothetical protein
MEYQVGNNSLINKFSIEIKNFVNFASALKKGLFN